MKKPCRKVKYSKWISCRRAALKIKELTGWIWSVYYCKECRAYHMTKRVQCIGNENPPRSPSKKNHHR